MFEFTVYVCINECVLTTFDPPALFATARQCLEAADELRAIVVEATQLEHAGHGHPPDWAFETYDACVPYEPEPEWELEG